MHIKDYESGRELRDVDIILTRDEAEELMGYLAHLLQDSHVKVAHLTEVHHLSPEKEIALSIQRQIHTA